MKRYIIVENEEYPVYMPSESTHLASVEIHDAFIERYEKAAKEWYTVQDVLSRHCDVSAAKQAELTGKNLCTSLIESPTSGRRRACAMYIGPSGTCYHAHRHVR